MKFGAPGSFGAHLRSLRLAAGFTQEELATVAGLSVHAVSALERGERRRPHLDTVRALAGALELSGSKRDVLFSSARVPAGDAAVDELSEVTLPVAPTGLVGRDDDVAALQAWLRDRGGRLVTLVGPGGVGKTRLATEVAGRLAAEGHLRAVFVDLASARDTTDLAMAIAEGLGIENVSIVDVPGRVRLACVGETGTLLVLDNCEQVSEAAAFIAELLASAASLRLLATSRAALRVRGERLYPVVPLALDVGGEDDRAGQPRAAPAVRLFVERARDAVRTFELTAANRRVIASICRRLDSLPLAIELAAPWLKVLSAEDLLRRLERDALLPAAGPEDLPERQRTLNATVAWSYRLLDAAAQRAFRRFSVVPGLFSLDAAVDLLGGAAGSATEDDALVAAASLIERSLLQRVETRDTGTPAYRMLHTVRAYGALELDAAAEREDALEGLARFSAREASFTAAGLVGREQVVWLDRARDSLPAYRAALPWLIGRDRRTEAADIVAALTFFWFIRGHVSEGLRWCEEIIAAGTRDERTEGRLLIAMATLLYARGDLDRARVAVARARELAGQPGDLGVSAQADHLAGHIEIASGDTAAARELFARAVDGFRLLSVPWGVGTAVSGLAWVSLATGDHDAAERLLDEATLALQDAGPWFFSLASYLRAVLAIRRGRADDAVLLVGENLARIREVQDKFAFTYAMVPLAAAATMTGDYAWVARILGAQEAVIERFGAAVSDPTVSDLRDRAAELSREALGPDAWARAHAAGRSASIDALLTDIDGVAL